MKPKLLFGSGLIVGFVVAFTLLSVMRAHYTFRTGPQGILWRCDNFTGQVSWAQPGQRWYSIEPEFRVDWKYYKPATNAPPWENAEPKDPLDLFKK